MNRLLVIICTHNPLRANLHETLAALRAQRTPVADWNLLVVDNASAEPLDRWLDLSWHPRARVVREEKTGVARARHRALLEAKAADADTILFVDDDNILAEDYLQRGLELGEEWPRIACWGGQLLPRYAVEPPAWIGNYLNHLAIHPLASDLWCNCVKSYDMAPPTAGCFVRAPVWQRYLALIAEDPRRLNLTRAEDMDLVLTAIDLGCGVGRFRDLALTHIVPAARLTPAYVAGLIESTAIGMGMMEYIRYRRIPRRTAASLIERGILHWRAARLPEPLRSFRRAELRGRSAARRIVLAWQTAGGSAAPELSQPVAARA